MADLNWCTYCDNAIPLNSESLYCSKNCLRLDTLHHHPLLGYKYPEYQYFFKKPPKQQEESSRTPITSVQLYNPMKASVSCTLYKPASFREILH